MRDLLALLIPSILRIHVQKIDMELFAKFALNRPRGRNSC